MDYAKGMTVRIITDFLNGYPRGSICIIEEVVTQGLANGNNALLRLEGNLDPASRLVWGEGRNQACEIELVDIDYKADRVTPIIGKFYVASCSGEQYDYIIRLDSAPGCTGYTRYNSSLWVQTGTRRVVDREGGFHSLLREATDWEVQSYFKDFISSQPKTEADVTRQSNEGNLRRIPGSKREGKRRSEDTVQGRKGKVKLAIDSSSNQGRASGCKVKTGRVKVGIPT